MTRGLYRTIAPETGVEVAFVRLADASGPIMVPRSAYEAQGYRPPFRALPPQQLYETMTRPIGHAPEAAASLATGR